MGSLKQEVIDSITAAILSRPWDFQFDPWYHTEEDNAAEPVHAALVDGATNYRIRLDTFQLVRPFPADLDTPEFREVVEAFKTAYTREKFNQALMRKKQGPENPHYPSQSAHEAMVNMGNIPTTSVGTQLEFDFGK